MIKEGIINFESYSFFVVGKNIRQWTCFLCFMLQFTACELALNRVLALEIPEWPDENTTSEEIGLDVSLAVSGFHGNQCQDKWIQRNYKNL